MCHEDKWCVIRLNMWACDSRKKPRWVTICLNRQNVPVNYLRRTSYPLNGACFYDDNIYGRKHSSNYYCGEFRSLIKLTEDFFSGHLKFARFLSLHRKKKSPKYDTGIILWVTTSQYGFEGICISFMLWIYFRHNGKSSSWKNFTETYFSFGKSFACQCLRCLVDQLVYIVPKITSVWVHNRLQSIYVYKTYGIIWIHHFFGEYGNNDIKEMFGNDVMWCVLKKSFEIDFSWLI